MKKPILLSACLLLLVLSAFIPESTSSGLHPAYVQSNDTLENYLVLKAHVRKSPRVINESDKEDSQWLDSALITILQNGIPYSEIWTNKRGKCSFKLALNKVYQIEVSKEGFVTKIIEVNTKVRDRHDYYSFDFDIDIFEKVKGLDVSVLEKPIARVSYNYLDERFGYDVSYTSKINAELKKMYKSYYQLQKMMADSIQKAGVKPVGQK